MNKEEFMKEVSRKIKYRSSANDILDELESHIDEATDAFIDMGMSEKEAEEKAVLEMGDVSKIVDNINKIHRPKIDFKVLGLETLLLAISFFIAYIRANIEPIGPECESVTRLILYICIGFIGSGIIYFSNYKKYIEHPKIMYGIATVIISYALIVNMRKNGTLILYTPFVSFTPAVMVIPLYIMYFVGELENLIRKKKNFVNNEKDYYLKIIDFIGLSLISIVLLLKTSSIIGAIMLGLIYLIMLVVRENENINLDEKLIKHIEAFIICLFLLSIVSLLTFVKINYGGITIDNFEKVYNEKVVEKNQDIIIHSANLYGSSDNLESEELQEKIDLIDSGTNYAYSAIIINYGWIFTAVVSLCIIAFCIKLIIDATKVKEQYGNLLIIGISTLFIFEYIFNILMNLNLGIKNDLGLPLISWGGVSLIIHMMCLSLILSIYRRKDIISLQNNVNFKKN